MRIAMMILRGARGLVALVLLGLALHCPAQTMPYPPNSGWLNVKDFGAMGDGVTDDTAAFIAALASFTYNGGHPNNRRPLYIPDGVYLLSDEVYWRRWVRLIGQNRASTILRLKDSASGYGNPAMPKPLLRCVYSNNESFANYVENLTIDTGSGNPGAIAFRYNNHNEGAIRNVSIRSGDGFGVIGLDMTETEFGPGLIRDVSIDGFDTGIKTPFNLSHATFVDITLRNQKVVGFDNSMPVAIENLASENSVPALINRNPWTAHCVLIGATLVGGASDRSAIENQADVYLRGVVSAGYARALSNHGTNVSGSTLAEFTHGLTHNLFGEAPAHLNLPIERPDDSFELPVNQWVMVDDSAGDDTAAIQAAIDSGAEILYLKFFGSYTVTDTIHIRGNKRVFPSIKRMVAMAPMALGDHVACRRVVGGEDGDCSVALVIMSLALRDSGAQWEYGRRAFQGLGLRFLVDA